LTGSVTFAAATTTVSAGSFSLNGTTFTTTSSMTVLDVVNSINNASASTGVSADFTAGAGITLRANNFGSGGSFTLSDASGVINSAGVANATGVDAVASVTIDTNGSTAGGLSTVTFTGGKNGQSGLVLSDSTGNFITLTETGNATTAAFLAGNLNVGSAQFQIGANAGQTINLSLGNFAAAQLGAKSVAGMNLSNLDITTATGSTNSLMVIDAAIDEVTRARGEVGSFQRNALESNIRSLGIARENLAATESSIRDTDVASEMTYFTKLQILQQSGMSMLAQANSAPQAVLSLLRG
jgi:flagellin